MQTNNRRITRITVTYLLILSALIWFLYFQSIETPDQLWGVLPGFKLNQLFIPLVSLVTLIYASYMTTLLTVGRLTKPIQNTLRVTSITLPLALASNWAQVPYYLRSPMRLPFFISTILSLLYLAQKHLNENKNYSPIYQGIRLGAIGLAVHPVYRSTLTELRSISLTGEPLPIPVDILNSQMLDSTGLAFRNASLLLMVISVFSILCKTQDLYLRYIGKLSGEKLYAKLVLFWLLGIYFLSGRAIIIGAGWVNWQLLIAIEWLVITLSFYLGYRSMNRYVASLVEEYAEVEDWYKHIQQVEYTSDKKHEELTRLITGFVENGEKSRLVTQLASLLTKSGYETEKTHRILRNLIEYNEPALGPILFRWQIKQYEKMNQTLREILIKEVFDGIDGRIIFVEDQKSEETEVALN